MSLSRDSLLAEVARAQHGLFRRTQALEAGFPASTINDLVRRGTWVRVGRGVLAPAALPATYRRSAMAAVLSFDEATAVASHECAGTLHGFRYLDNHPIVVTVPSDRWNRLHGVIVHRSSDLIDEQVAVRHDIPVTSPVRTMIDLAGVLHPSRLEMVLDAALGSKLVELPMLVRTFNQVARRGRPGAGHIRALLAARADGYVASDSELERRLRAFLTRYGFPQPVAQLPTWWEGRLIGLADFAYPSVRVLLELDGRLGHSQLVDFERDRLRDQRAIAAGWRVIRVTWRQLHRHPEQVREVLAAVLPNVAA